MMNAPPGLGGSAPGFAQVVPVQVPLVEVHVPDGRHPKHALHIIE